MNTGRHENGVVLVGVDGSPGSRRPLRWAIDRARLHSCAVEAVTAWQENEMGVPEEVLVRRSTDASLLVVGSHAVGSMRHTALGGTSDYCSRMTKCPVVVLPIEADRAPAVDLALPS